MGEVSVTVVEHQTLNTSKGFITCDGIKGMTNEDIQKELASQNVKEVYRIMKRKKNGNSSETQKNNPTNQNDTKPNDSDFDPTDSFIITFNTPILPSDLKIGYLRVNVRLYIPNPRRCNKCQMYGHVAKFCQHDLICPKCGQEGHEDKRCDNDKSCYHCKKSHETWSRQCPMWKLEKQIIEEKTKNNITFKDARTRIYSSNQDLVSQVPKLNRYLQNKTTYSNISAQPDVITSLQETIKQLKDQNKALQMQISELVGLISHEKQIKFNLASTSLELPDIDPVRPKRLLHESSSEEDINEPSAKRATSEGQEANMPTASPPEERIVSPEVIPPSVDPLTEEEPSSSDVVNDSVEMEDSASVEEETTPPPKEKGGDWDVAAKDGKHRTSPALKPAPLADRNKKPMKRDTKLPKVSKAKDAAAISASQEALKIAASDAKASKSKVRTPVNPPLSK